VGEDNGIRILENVTRSDSGTYECSSLDFDTGSDAEGYINITVHCKSTFLSSSCAVVDFAEIMSLHGENTLFFLLLF